MRLTQTRTNPRSRVLPLLIALVALAVACQPVPHPRFEAIDPARTLNVLPLTQRLTRWELATGATTFVGPAGVAWRDPHISEDGSIAWYGTGDSRPTCMNHFVDIATGVTNVHERCPRLVGASGRYLLDELDFEMTTGIFGNFGGPTRLQLVATNARGTVLGEATAIPGSQFAEIHLADAAPVYWAADERWAGNVTDTCGTPTTPPCDYREETLSLLLGSEQGTTRVGVSSDLATAFMGQALRTVVTGDGRSFVYSGSDGAVHVRDRFGSRHEVLPGDDARSSKPHVSDDGKVIVTGEPSPRLPATGWYLPGPGWFEYLADDAP
jgi:hypothetical protein